MLCVCFDDKEYDLDVPQALIRDAESFYQTMDKDMDKGWQISRQWVDNPDTFERCQIVADQILTAFHDEDEDMILLMAGYILSRLPQAKRILIDSSGDISQTDIQG
ncbi:MAG: hypothetical protein R3240_00220 [Gammaproteobacteria bacterium]|nr:hypothetical protein [Gammaproteobacteria bacterium]